MMLINGFQRCFIITRVAKTYRAVMKQFYFPNKRFFSLQEGNNIFLQIRLAVEDNRGRKIKMWFSFLFSLE